MTWNSIYPIPSVANGLGTSNNPWFDLEYHTRQDGIPNQFYIDRFRFRQELLHWYVFLRLHIKIPAPPSLPSAIIWVTYIQIVPVILALETVLQDQRELG
jgi:hypothetical protein